MEYKALHVEETNDGVFEKKIKSLPLKELDTEEVLIKVHYSALNYKDALSASGNKGVSKNFPHTPGIDATGIVQRSSVPSFKEGDKVIVTSFDLGMNTKGGLAEYISVPSCWIVPLPYSLSLKEAASIGTAGLTAAIGIDKLLKNGLNAPGRILVTGASGAVGSFSVKLLSKLGFEVVAYSKKESKKDFLYAIGAKEVITEIEHHEKRPLLKPKFDGAFDVIGGLILENILKQIKPEGSVAICGLAGSASLNTTVFPFILRGVNILGVDSAEFPSEKRVKIWSLLADEWKIDLESIVHEHSLEETPELLDMILERKSFGRALISMQKTTQ